MQRWHLLLHFLAWLSESATSAAHRPISLPGPCLFDNAELWVWLLWWFLSEPRIATQDRDMHRARGSSSRSANLATMTWVLGATGWMLRTIFEPVFEVDFCIVNGSLASWHRAVLSGHV